MEKNRSFVQIKGLGVNFEVSRVGYKTESDITRLFDKPYKEYDTQLVIRE